MVHVGTAQIYPQEHGLRFNPEHPPLGKLAIATGRCSPTPASPPVPVPMPLAVLSYGYARRTPGAGWRGTSRVLAPGVGEAFGGPARAHPRPHDSNVDWGHGPGRLADRLRGRHRDERVWPVYQGSGVPSAYGIHARDPRAASPARLHGPLVVSDSSAAGAMADWRR
jgi:hypothetical protein